MPREEGDPGRVACRERAHVGGDAILEVAQVAHVRDPLGGVRVLDRHAEVALDHLELVLAQHVELDGRDPEALRLLARSLVLVRPTDHDPHLAAGCAPVVGEDVAQVTPCENDLRRQLRRREEAARQVERERDRRDERRRDLEVPIGLRPPVHTVTHDRPVGEEQEGGRDGDEIQHVAQVDHPAGDALVVRQERQPAHELARPRRHREEDEVEPDHQEEEADRHGDHERRDLVPGEARRPDPDRGEERHDEQRAQVLAGHHPAVGVAREVEAESDRKREPQPRAHEEEAPEVLPEDQLPLAQRLGEDELEGAAAPLLGEGSHRDRGHEEEEEPRQEIEHGAQRRLPQGERGPEVEEEVEDEEDDEEDVRRRVIEEPLPLLAGDRPDPAHANRSPSPGSARGRWTQGRPPPGAVPRGPSSGRGPARRFAAGSPRPAWP